MRSSGLFIVFPSVTKAFGVVLVPFFFMEFVLKPEMMLPDNLHPRGEAQPLLLARIWPVLKSLLN